MVAGQYYGINFSILLGVDLGHSSLIFTIPMNAMVSFDSGNDQMGILKAGVLGSVHVSSSKGGRTRCKHLE